MNETRPLAGALWMLAAMLVIGVIDNFVMVIAGVIGLWQLYVFRFAIAFPLIWLMAAGGMGTMRMARPGRVAARSLFVALAMLFYFAALAAMPIAQALAGLFTSPIFVLMITAFVLKQRIGPWRIIAVAVGFAGVVMVLGPDAMGEDGLDPWMLVPVAGGFFYALGAIATRAWCAGESTVSLLLGVMGMQGLMGAAALALLAGLGVAELEGPMGFVTRGWVWPITPILAVLLVQAGGSVAGVFGIIKGYQLADASYIAVFEYSVMIFGPLFAWFWFGQGVTAMQGAGIALISLAGMIIALRSR